jgi:hypothetical protein
MISLSSLPLLWALEFANPALLAGLGAASIPIIIHLLNRRKFREMPWAAMQFLMAAIRKNQRRVRIEQWLLLAVRTLLVLLIVAAMAKPFLERFGNVIGDRRTHRVLVVDGSLSMGYTSGDKSRFELAKAVATRLVKDSRLGDAISLIVMGEPPRVVIADPQPILSEVQKEIAELMMTHASTDLQATFEAIDRVLDVSSIPQKEIIFLTDLQATSWRRQSATDKDGFDRILARLEIRKPRSVIIDLGKVGSENRAVTDLKLDAPVVTAGSTPLVRGVVRNFGPSKAEGVLVRLIMDGRVSSEQSVDLPIGENVPVIFNQPFTAAGDHVVEVSIDHDALPLDDHRWLVVPVREALNVLLVDGHFRSEPFQAETDYLAQALSPSEESPGQPGIIRSEVITESRLKSAELARHDVVALCNVPQFSPGEVSALEDYLMQGGGLIIFLGDQVMADNYNRLLYADGKGLLPAALGTTVGDASRKEAAFAFDPKGYRHPLIAEFRGESDPVTAGLTQTAIWQYQKLTKLDSKAQVAIAFDSGDPAIVEAPRARGKVILVATSADTGWNTWPLHNSYPPIMQQTILEAAAGRLAERNIRVSQPYDQSFAATGAAAAATVINPKGQAAAVRLKPAGGISELHFAQTELSGKYQLQIGPPLSVENAFAANPDPAESDLTKLDRGELERKLQGWRFDILTNGPELSQSAVAVSRRGELHRPLLHGALALLLLETFLAWKFGHHAPSS